MFMKKSGSVKLGQMNLHHLLTIHPAPTTSAAFGQLMYKAKHEQAVNQAIISELLDFKRELENYTHK